MVNEEKIDKLSVRVENIDSSVKEILTALKGDELGASSGVIKKVIENEVKINSMIQQNKNTKFWLMGFAAAVGASFNAVKIFLLKLLGVLN